MQRSVFLCLLGVVLYGSAFAGDNKKEVLTLSKGKYVEVFDQDSIEQVGNIVYNVNTQQIVGFIDDNETVAASTMQPEIISRWLSIDPLAEKYYSISPYAFGGNNPINFIDPDGRDIVYFNSAGGEIARQQSTTQFQTFVQTPFTIRFAEAQMPNIIQSRDGANTTGEIYQKYDYKIAAETYLFNTNKDLGIVPTYTNGKTIEDPGTVPDLDPTAVKAIIMQESSMGTYDRDPTDNNNGKSDIMQANVHYKEASTDWNESKKQFGLEKGKGATPDQSIKAGIGILYQKGLKGSNGKSWTGGKNWENAIDRYNGGGVEGYKGKVLEMQNNSKERK